MLAKIGFTLLLIATIALGISIAKEDFETQKLFRESNNETIIMAGAGDQGSRLVRQGSEISGGKQRHVR